MIRQSIGLALSVALLCPAVFARQQAAPEPAQAPPAEAPPAPRTADLGVEFSRMFPERTAIYIEIQHLGTVAGLLGSDAMLEVLNTHLAGPPPKEEKGKPKPKPEPAISSRDFNVLLDASAALAVIAPPGRDLASLDVDSQPAVVALRMNAKDGPKLFGDLVLKRFAGGDSLPTPEKIHGVDVYNLPSFSYAISGRTILAGDRAKVVTVLDTLASDDRRLGDDPGFVSAMSKHASGIDQFFAFLSRHAISGMAGGFFGIGGAAAKDPTSPQALEREAMRSFAGIEALQGIAIGARIDGLSVKVRYDVEIDRSRNGLVTTLTDPPAIGFRAAELLPADTEQLTIVSLDPGRIYDLFEQSFASLPPRTPNSSTFVSDLGEIEQQIGMSLRSELLPALGNEFAYTGTMDSFFGGWDAKRTNLHKPLSVAVVEVRDPDVARQALTNYLKKEGLPGPIPTMEYKGVDLMQLPGYSIAFVNGFGLAGPTDDVKRCIDAQVSEKTLAKNPEFGSQAAGWLGDTIFATFEQHAFRTALDEAEAKQRDEIRKNLGEQGSNSSMDLYLAMSNLPPVFPSVVFRDGTGIHWEANAPAAGLAGLGSAALKTVLASAGAASDKRDEPNIMPVLYTLASAEASFQADNGRFATLEELESENLLDREYVQRTLKTAKYRLEVTPIGSGDGARFEATATPVEYGNPNKLSFYVDQTFVVRAADKSGGPASVGDPPYGYDDEDIAVPAPPDDSGGGV